MDERFRDGLIAVFQLHVFAHQSHLDGRFWMLVLREEFLPRCEVRRLVSGGHAQFFEHNLIQTFFHQKQRHVINGFRIDALDDRAGGDVAEPSYFGSDRIGQFVFRSAHQDVRLNTEFQQLLDGVLGRLGLQFAGCRQVGNECQVHHQSLLGAFPLHLTNRLDVGQGLNVANRSSDFRDDEVVIRLGT